MLGVPKSTLRFDDSLRNLIRSIEAVVLMVMVYYSKKIQIKMQMKKCIGQSLEEMWHRDPGCPLSVEFYGFILPAMMCDKMYEVLPTREVHLRLEGRVFIGGQSQWYGGST